MRTYDLIVIGSGPVGRRAAIQVSKFGERVLVVEKGRRVCGVSVHTGTIPVQDVARNRTEPIRLARARVLWPLLPRQTRS
jgi:pyruvate/2-oxoglutarate dehydrogenase complex dihydrolipoamide dehydrogenase (E3) component